jgi:5-methylcytosine-specific restriction endonuclease McrA
MPKDPRDSRQWRALRKVILQRDGYICYYCGQGADTVDHIMPVSHHPDMAMSAENLVSACKPCNSRKGSRSQGVFLAQEFTPPIFPSNISPIQSRPVIDSPFTVRPNPDAI